MTLRSLPVANAMSRAISEELAPIDLSLLPDVGLELQTSWQRSNSGPAVAGEVTDALPFTITGPAHVCDFLDEEGASKTGHLAPPNKITIQGERARRAGIPKHAASYAFAYPLESLSGDLYERIVCAEGKSDPWLFFLLLGGFVYFDVHRKLICCNAFVLTPSEHALTLAGPFQPSAGALEHLRETKRLRKITLGPLVASGFEQIAWINPAEKPGGGGSPCTWPPCASLLTLPAATTCERSAAHCGRHRSGQQRVPGIRDERRADDPLHARQQGRLRP